LGINLHDASCGKAAGAPSRRRHSADRRGRMGSALTVAATRQQGGCVMIEFILIVVAVLLLIGIFVRREVFK
jgi:hypothetical protein